MNRNTGIAAYRSHFTSVIAFRNCSLRLMVNLELVIICGKMAFNFRSEIYTDMKRLSKLTVVVSALLITACATSTVPLTTNELERLRAERVAALQQNQEPIAGPISLYEAMARALKYNLDYRLEQMTTALAVREHELSRWDMLPKLVAEAGYTSRDNFSGSRSSALLSATEVGDQSLVPSTSSERDVLDANLTASWDILDFGLSYVRSKQAADEALIADENRRKIVNRIIEDVRTAYWRAVSAERLTSRLSDLEGEIEKALDSSREVYQRRQSAPLAALSYQRELLQVRQQINTLKKDLVIARKQLAALINLRPEEDFELVMPDRDNSVVELGINAEELIDMAMLYRPELREVSYRQRINKQEAKAAFLQMLPGVNLFAGLNYNSNDFLFSNNWTSIGARASWNLFDAFRYPTHKRQVAAQQDVLDQRALAVSMAVMTQVGVSASRFQLAKENLGTLRDYHDVQGEIQLQTNAGFNARRVSHQNYIRESLNSIVSDAKYDIAMAELQNAFANIYASVGLDPYDENTFTDDEVSVLAEKLRVHWLARGDKTRFTR